MALRFYVGDSFSSTTQVIYHEPSLNAAHLITSVFTKLDASNHLLINKVCSDGILGRVVPWSKDLFPEEQSPRSVPLLSTLFFCILFTLWDGVHNMITTTAKRGYLQSTASNDFAGRPFISYIFLSKCIAKQINDNSVGKSFGIQMSRYIAVLKKTFIFLINFKQYVVSPRERALIIFYLKWPIINMLVEFYLILIIKGHPE